MPSWPRQREVIGKIRKVLRRVYGAEDAWVIQREGECRLEVLVQGRRVVLYAAQELFFWPQFYREKVRITWRGSERRTVALLRPRGIGEIVEILQPYWDQLIGRKGEEDRDPPRGEEGGRGGSGDLPQGVA